MTGTRLPSRAALALALLAMAGTGRAESPLPTPAEAAELVPLLQKNYYYPPALKEIRSGADLLAAWPGLRGVSLLKAGEVAARSPIRSETLPGRIGYWRAAGFGAPKEGALLASGLADWERNDPAGLIVDLRDTAAVDDYAGAARAASFFVAPGTVLFSVQGLQVPQQVFAAASPGGHPFPAPLVVLVNGQTRGAGEALADALRRDAGAIVVGRSTAGEAALFTQARLRSGRFARIATAPVLLPDGTLLFGRPVAPDIAVYVDARAEAEALAQIGLGSAAKGLVEAPARHRMNEASLVHEENPEIEEVLSEQVRRAEGDPAGPFQDATLVRAVDIVRGIGLYPVPGQAPATTPAPARTASVEAGAPAAP